jgi:signal peptidase
MDAVAGGDGVVDPAARTATAGGAAAGTTTARGTGLPRALRVADRVSTAVCALALTLLAALLLATAAGYRPLVDHSDSMRPAIRAGDLLITRGTPASSIRRGTVVSFKDPALAGKLVTHRVIAIHSTAGRVDFLTKGDANSTPETWSVAPGASVGTLALRVPEIGRAIAWMADPLVRTTILTLAALLLSTALLRRIWKA